jgi:hypothetical protein
VSTTPLAIVYGRLVVIGGDSYRLHEELIAAGGEISQGPSAAGADPSAGASRR